MHTAKAVSFCLTTASSAGAWLPDQGEHALVDRPRQQRRRTCDRPQSEVIRAILLCDSLIDIGPR